MFRLAVRTVSVRRLCRWLRRGTPLVRAVRAVSSVLPPLDLPRSALGSGRSASSSRRPRRASIRVDGGGVGVAHRPSHLPHPSGKPNSLQLHLSRLSRIIADEVVSRNADRHRLSSACVCSCEALHMLTRGLSCRSVSGTHKTDRDSGPLRRRHAPRNRQEVTLKQEQLGAQIGHDVA